MKYGIKTFFAAAIASVIGIDAGAAHDIQPSQLRHQVDVSRNRVWSLTNAGVVLHDIGSAEKTTIALPDWLLAAARYADTPDLALGPRGEAVITSNIVPTLWRIDADTLAVTVHALELDADAQKDVGFSGLVYSPAQSAFFAVGQADGAVWRIDTRLEQARKMAPK